MVGELQEPSLKYALSSVKICRGSKDIEKNGLDDFLSLAWISHDSQSYAENKMVVPVKQNCESFVTAAPEKLHQLFIGKLREVRSRVWAITVGERADRNVFRVHGFIDLNSKSRAADAGRKTDHPFAVRLLVVDLALETVKPHSPKFPGTSLQRDRWDFYSDRFVSTYLYKRLCIAPGFHLSIPFFGRHLAIHAN